MGSEFPSCVWVCGSLQFVTHASQLRLRCLVRLGAGYVRRGQPSRALRQNGNSHIEALRCLQKAALGKTEWDAFDLCFGIMESRYWSGQ